MPEIMFADLNPEQVQDAVLSTYEQISGQTLCWMKRWHKGRACIYAAGRE